MNKLPILQPIKLPPHLPGVERTIPLDLLPAYLERYGLQPMRFTRVRAIELETGAVREDGVLWLEHQEEA